jgi:hypothetical protein
MSEQESAPKKVIPRPIKAADLPPKSADALSNDGEKRDRGDKRGGDNRGKGGRKGREDKEEAPRVSAALQRGPKYTPPKPAPEPVVEEEVETPEAEGAEASTEAEAPVEATPEAE